MLQEIIPIMDFSRNYNLVPSRSIARFLLTVVTSVKLDDFGHFMRFSPGCLNIGSECLCLFSIVSFFYCGWVIQEFLFVFHFFKPPSLSAHHQFSIFILLFSLAFSFLSSNISNRVGAHLISAMVWNKHRGQVKNILRVCVTKPSTFTFDNTLNALFVRFFPHRNCY